MSSLQNAGYGGIYRFFCWGQTIVGCCIHTSHCRAPPGDRDVGLPSNDRGDRHSHRCRRRPDANACAMSDAMNAGRAWHGRGHASDVRDGRKHEVSVTDVKDVYWL